MKCVLLFFFYRKLDDDAAVDGNENEDEEKRSELKGSAVCLIFNPMMNFISCVFI